MKVNNPFVPISRIKYAAADHRYADLISGPLSELGITVIPIPETEDIAEPVCSHADMLLYWMGRGKLGIYCGIYDKMAPMIRSIGLEPVKLTHRLNKSYPRDIGYNFLFTNKCIIGKTEHISDDIRCGYPYMSVENVNQGYARCSCAQVGANAIITEDVSIYKKAVQLGLDVLKISDLQIELPGYNAGFIGGASGLIDEHTLVFTGDISDKEKKNKITEFCFGLGVECIFLLDQDHLIDIGGIMPLI